MVESNENSMYDRDFEHRTNIFIEDKQQESILNFYTSYVDCLDNIRTTKPSKLKRSFDAYISMVEENYIQKMKKTVCDLYKREFGMDIDGFSVKKHPDHPDSMFKVLNDEFYMLFKVLYIHWVGDELSKKDLQLISPCKVFMTQTIMIRKYDERITFKSAKEMKHIFNNLRDTTVDRRDEEINKFLIKKIIKQMLKEDLPGDDAKAIKIYHRYFQTVMDKKEFHVLFTVTEG